MRHIIIRKVRMKKNSQCSLSLPSWVFEDLGFDKDLGGDEGVFLVLESHTETPDEIKLRRATLREIRIDYCGTALEDWYQEAAINGIQVFEENELDEMFLEQREFLGEHLQLERVKPKPANVFTLKEQKLFAVVNAPFCFADLKNLGASSGVAQRLIKKGLKYELMFRKGKLPPRGGKGRPTILYGKTSAGRGDS